MEFFEKLTPQQAQNLNAAVLAYVGDAVQSLYVRQRLALQHDCNAHGLHQMASAEVNAHSQAVKIQQISHNLTSEEKEVFFRGRNVKAHHKAKNQSGSDYRKATGLEALLGYLYLTGNIERIKQLLEV